MTEPMTTADSAADRPISSEVRAPCATPAATSRPSASVPSRKRPKGGCKGGPARVKAPAG